MKEGLECAPGPVAGTLSIRLHGRPPRADARLVRSDRGPSQGAVRYERIVPVAWDADVTRAKATLADGLLTVTVPRRTERAEKGTH